MTRTHNGTPLSRRRLELCTRLTVGVARQTQLRQLVLVRRVTRDELQQEIAATTDHVALAHLRPIRDELLESGQHQLLLAVEPDNGEECYLPPKLLRVGIRMVAADHARLLEPPNAAQARRRRDPRTSCQFHIGLCQRCSRLVRKTLSFSKKLANHIGAVWYFIHDYNAQQRTKLNTTTSA